MKAPKLCTAGTHIFLTHQETLLGFGDMPYNRSNKFHRE